MIKTPTTFVVGAGASNGLPTGAALKAAAVSLEPDHAAFQLLITADIEYADIETALSELRADSLAGSIDEFLEPRQHRPQMMRVGHALIATLLGSSIAATRRLPIPDNQDWLGYIIRRMREGARTCAEFVDGNAGIRFVTFNFDDRIERRLTKEAQSIFADAPGKDLERVHVVRVVHVHGKLPDPPAQPLQEGAVTFNLKEWVDWTKTAPQCVRVVHDEIDPKDEEAAKGAMDAAQVICFVGFAYAPTNLKRLGVPATVRLPGRYKSLYGSAFGMRDGERERISGRFGGVIHLGGASKNCLDVLYDFPVLRD